MLSRVSPSLQDVLNAAGQQALEMLEGVDAELYPHFFPAAEQLIAERGPLNAVASALAAISGFREPPKPKSLLTFEEVRGGNERSGRCSLTWWL